MRSDLSCDLRVWVNMRPFLTAFLTAVLAPPLTAQAWQSSLDSLAKLNQFSGVVLVAQGGVPQFERAYGMADREAGRTNNLETSFNLGSINKLFTGIAIRQLAAAGKLNIDSSLSRAWPDYPNQDAAPKVTIRQILEHRSGIQGNVFAAPSGNTRHGKFRRWWLFDSARSAAAAERAAGAQDRQRARGGHGGDRGRRPGTQRRGRRWSPGRLRCDRAREPGSAGGGASRAAHPLGPCPVDRATLLLREWPDAFERTSP